MRALLCLLIAIPASSQATEFLYDDFSAPSLDASKWVVRSDIENNPLLDVYGVAGGVFHSDQPVARNAVVQIEMTRVFQPGEAVEYDVTLNGGSGNRLHIVYVNDWNTGAGDGAPGTGLPACVRSQIGYWNAESCIGSATGTYHVRVEFNADETISLKFRRPDGTMVEWLHQVPDAQTGSPPASYSPPFKIGFASRAGHDGTLDIDYDNVRVFSTAPVPVQGTTFGRVKAGQDIVSR